LIEIDVAQRISILCPVRSSAWGINVLLDYAAVTSVLVNGDCIVLGCGCLSESAMYTLENVLFDFFMRCFHSRYRLGLYNNLAFLNRHNSPSADDWRLSLARRLSVVDLISPSSLGQSFRADLIANAQRHLMALRAAATCCRCPGRVVHRSRTRWLRLLC